MTNYPNSTSVVIMLDSLIKHDERLQLHERMSSRMVKCASILPADEFIGWNLCVPQKGLASLSIFGSSLMCVSDLEWIVEHTATIKSSKSLPKKDLNECNKLYELILPIQMRETAKIGFGASITKDLFKWPDSFSSQFTELVRAFQSTGAEFTAVIGSATEEEQSECKRALLETWDSGKGVSIEDYAGRPIKSRYLLRLPSAPTVRLLTVLEEAVPGIQLKYRGDLTSDICSFLLNNPLIDAPVYPDYASRIMIMEPEASETMVGIEVCEEKAKPIPVNHKNTKSKKAVVIGRAVTTSGIKKRISIGDIDLRRHYQIVGQTGTGKSTLLSTIILSAIEQDYGLTFFDPHGSTIDTLLRCIPEKYAKRVRVVRIGDAENPVPLNIWDSDNPAKEERNINDLCELFGDIFDPRKEGFVGPRYERWLSLFAKASIAFLGRMASLESIAVISQSKDNMLKVCAAILDKYPELVESIKQEYGLDNSRDFHETLAWFLCKFQRLTSVEQLRKTLGAGTNALDFLHTLDTNTVTLIDLASPTIGAHASRIVGTLQMMKLWNAAMKRKDRDKTHLVVVDEASLFRTNPMPRMLAESRKFGLSMVLCHQHSGQLSDEIREALEANCANFSAFRLSTHDAHNAVIRFDNPDMEATLTRLDAFNAITSLSVDNQQTPPFTLEITRPKMQPDGDKIAELIETRSRERLVEPYRKISALTSKEIQDLLNSPENIEKKKPAWLEMWESKRNKLKNAG